MALFLQSRAITIGLIAHDRRAVHIYDRTPSCDRLRFDVTQVLWKPRKDLETLLLLSYTISKFAEEVWAISITQWGREDTESNKVCDWSKYIRLGQALSLFRLVQASLFSTRSICERGTNKSKFDSRSLESE